MTGVRSVFPRGRRRRLAVGGFIVSLAAQVVLVVVGIGFILTPAIKPALVLLVVWCIIGTLYVITVWTLLTAAARWAETDEPPLVLELSRPTRVISVTSTALVSLVGVAAAVQHIFFLDPFADHDSFLLNAAGIWAMVLAWMLLHWGFSQLYLQDFYRDGDRPLRFPGTDSPGFLEFAYFAYTVAVSLAVSDVQVVDRRMRGRVLGHAVLSFFFNGLIIVTALGAIAEAGGRR
ncbi:DUF1345 domain-containing protein [Microbacterium sp. RD1]|uniref:DUF1345 domain-containing protein n=1 Tax=Microbacterium sp. RD1 TaxID=3457313 RepID=UPI003FA5DA8C